VWFGEVAGNAVGNGLPEVALSLGLTGYLRGHAGMGDSCPAMCVEQAIGPRADRPSVCDSIRQPLPHVLIPTMRKQYAGMDDSRQSQAN
jgi:hypothetical protein